MKLALALLALSSSALAQTPAPPATPAPKPAVAPAHKAATSATAPAAGAAKTVSTLPKVVGIPHTLYALKYIDIKIGTGPMSEPHKFYTVQYTGWFPNGTKFDSSYDHGQPFTFPYGAQRVIIGWDTGFEGMRIGGKRRLFVPYELAYGLTGRPPQMPPKSNLIFDVELVSISDKPPAPKTPPGAPKTLPITPGKPGVTPPTGTTPGTPPAGTAPATPPASTAPATPPPASTTPPPAAPAKPATPPSL